MLGPALNKSAYVGSSIKQISFLSSVLPLVRSCPLSSPLSWLCPGSVLSAVLSAVVSCRLSCPVLSCPVLSYGHWARSRLGASVWRNGLVRCCDVGWLLTGSARAVRSVALRRARLWGAYLLMIGIVVFHAQFGAALRLGSF